MADQNPEKPAGTFSMDNLLFPKIFRLFKITIQPGRILTALLAIILIYLTGWLMDLHKTVVVSGRISPSDLRISTLDGSPAWPTELHCFIGYPERLDSYIKSYKERAKDYRLGVFKVFSNFCLANFNEGVVYLLNLKFDKVIAAVGNCIMACVWVLKYHTIYGIIFFVISFAVLSLAGGAISRGAALQFTRDERAGMASTIAFALKNYVPILCAPTAPLVLVVLLGFVIISVIGLMANIPYAGELILALFFLLVLFAGAVMAFTTIWACASFNLMFGAIAAEKSDTFDALSRAYNYVYSRPWRLGGYTILAAFYGGVCYLFVRFFAYVTLLLSRWFLQAGVFAQNSGGQQFDKIDAIWPKPEYFNFLGTSSNLAKPLTQTIASGIVHFEMLIIAGLILAFVISYYFSAGTVIYCLLRKKVDNTPIEKVYIETTSQTQTTEQA